MKMESKSNPRRARLNSRKRIGSLIESVGTSRRASDSTSDLNSSTYSIEFLDCGAQRLCDERDDAARDGDGLSDVAGVCEVAGDVEAVNISLESHGVVRRNFGEA